MYACLQIELKNLCLQLKLEGTEAAGEDRNELEPLGYEVPGWSKGLSPCASSKGDWKTGCCLDSVSWPMTASFEGTVQSMAEDHQVRCKLLEALSDDVQGWFKGCEEDLVQSIEGIERELRLLKGFELRELRKLETTGAQEDMVEEDIVLWDKDPLVEREEVVSKAVDPQDDPPPLQSKIVSQEQVRRELEKWRDSMGEEVDSLVQKTEAVEDLTEVQYNGLVEDPDVSVELIPGKMVYVWKTSGRRRARMVGCGNFCQHDSSTQKADLFASGAGAESIRMMVRKCSLEASWHLASVDVKTAFLQAPLMEMQRNGKTKVTVVRVPSILREAGVTTAKYWKVKKALYGLNSAPKSWSTHRDKVLSDLRVECGESILRLRKTEEDANLWHVLEYSRTCGDPVNAADGAVDGPKSSGAKQIGVVALYVDDILIGSIKEAVKAIIRGLESHWDLSSPEWISEEGQTMKFAGYELERTSEGIRLHQESYAKDLLEQCQESVPGIEHTPAVKMGEFEDPIDRSERQELTKRAQSLIGQLLWLSGRTRPDIAFAVNMAAQKIVSSPREAVARAEHLVRYIRYAPGVGLHYKPPTGRCGAWEQLKFQETGLSLEAFSDASFAADEKSRSYGCVQLFWGGALIFWSSSRQTLIASHTAESELYSLSEAHLLGKAMRPTVAALMDVPESGIDCRLYCDNSAAIQLCILESGFVADASSEA